MMPLHEFALVPLAFTAVPGLEQTSLFLGGLIFLIAVLFHYLPDITRPDIFFAITVDPAFRTSEEARPILRQFRIAMWANSIVAIAIVWLGTAQGNEWIPLIGVLWQVVAMLPAFLRARKQTMPHSVAPTTHREAALTPRSKVSIGFALLLFGPFAILAACALYLKANWDRLPEHFPVHWGMNGEPNGWATRSISGVYGPLLMAFIICALLASFSYAIMIWTRHVWASDPQAQAESRFRHAQVGVLLLVEYFVAATLCAVPLLALRGNVNQMPGALPVIIGTFIFVLAIIAVLIYTGQGGARLVKSTNAAASDAKPTPVAGDRTPNQCWKAGMFYVNPDDPALLVEKRFGIGYTLNFGHPAAWLLLSLILAVAAGSVIIALLSTHPQ
jgi:uncharacterized membrane protein